MKIQKTTIHTIETSLNAIEESTFNSKSGNQTTIILLKTSDGSFTNYKELWDKFGIDPDNLKPGQNVMIEYVIYDDEKKQRQFKNFKNVTVL